MIKSKVFKTATHATLLHSSLELMTQKLDSKLMNAFAWRLAANAERLANGVVVPRWQTQPVDEWAAFEILSTRVHYTKTRKRGAVVKLLCLSGFAAGLEVEAFWSNKMFYAVAADVGFSKYARGKNPLAEFSQFVRMRVMGLVVQGGLGAEIDKPTVSVYDFKRLFAAYNKQLIKSRHIDQRSCPLLLKIPCHSCYAGYKINQPDRCDLATHPATFIVGTCTRCGTENFLDPDSNNQYCHRCRIVVLKKSIEGF